MRDLLGRAGIGSVARNAGMADSLDKPFHTQVEPLAGVRREVHRHGLVGVDRRIGGRRVQRGADSDCVPVVECGEMASGPVNMSNSFSDL